MKAKKIVLSILLFVMSLYVTHGLFFAEMEKHHHEIAEYISESHDYSSHEESCDFHFVFHQVFLLPQTLNLPEEISAKLFPVLEKKEYNFKQFLELYRPPIS